MSKKKIASPKWGYNRDISSPTDTWFGDVKKTPKTNIYQTPLKLLNMDVHLTTSMRVSINGGTRSSSILDWDFPI